MSSLIAVAFSDEKSAFTMREKLYEMQKNYLLQLEDAVVVTKDTQNKIKLHQAMNLTAVGAAGGGFWGMLVGMLFLNPLLGAAVGAGAGALSGALTDVGINDNFMKDLSQSITPGSSVLFVLVRSATDDKVLDGLRATGLHGTILKTSLAKDKEEQLREVLSSPAVQQELQQQAAQEKAASTNSMTPPPLPNN